MLRAIRTSDGETVEAWSQREAVGPFSCPACGGEVILRGGRRRLNHFAHAPEQTCRYDLGESENRGQSLNLLHDFNARDREWWKGGDMEIPPSKLYCDFKPVFWK